VGSQGPGPNRDLRERVRQRVPFAWVLAALVALSAGVAALRWSTSEDAGAAAKHAVGPGSPSPSSSFTRPAACGGRSERTALADYGDWARTLVDTRLRLPSDYVPPDLAEASAAGFDGAFLVRAFVIDDLRALGRAADAAGLPVDIAAAYRSYPQQRSLFRRRAKAEGAPKAEVSTARPGHSEHQLGTTIDFKTHGDLDVTRNWAGTPTGQWMEENAYRFGFMESYPAGKQVVTCYAYEPWHYRYFGPEIAARIHDSGLTVREWLWNEQP
jgi:zinc D-Ala-D-Ala carboxypeptidase